jgi:CBS domain containing-hemolysin-like protein
MLYRVFDVAAAETGEVMIPRERIDALSVALDVRQALSAALESPYTRHPVYRDDLDHVVGILHLRDLMTAEHLGTAQDASIEHSCVPPTSSPRPRISARCWPTCSARASTWQSCSTPTAPAPGP